MRERISELSSQLMNREKELGRLDLELTTKTSDMELLRKRVEEYTGERDGLREALEKTVVEKKELETYNKYQQRKRENL